MIEQQNINGRDVLLRVEPVRPKRENQNIIPTEYFTVSYYLEQGVSEENNGELINDEDGSPKLFESPVAALSLQEKNWKVFYSIRYMIHTLLILFQYS